MNEAGNGLLRSTGAGGASYASNFYRNGNISSGQSVAVDFRLDGTSTSAHFSLEVPSNNACRIGLVALSGKMVAQIIGCNYNNAVYTDLVNPTKTNTWYRVTLKVSDSSGFVLTVRERDTGAAAVNYSVAMPATGQAWRFHHWIDTGNAWLDNYTERSDAAQTTVYIGGYFEKNTTTNVATSYYAFNGQNVAMRRCGKAAR